MNEAAAVGQGSAVRRVAAIDVGTNSIRLIVAEAGPDGAYRVLDDEKETARLGQGLESTGGISAEAMERAAQAIARMKNIAEGFGVEVLRAIGTCAVREASNSGEFLALVRQRAGLTVEPIEAAEEAHLAHLSVGHAFDLRQLSAAVVDLGGGSTEIVLSSAGVIEEIYSLPLGAVRLTEQFGGAEAAAGDNFRDMRRAVGEMLRERVGRPPFAPQVLIGTGGTFTALANISRHRAARGNGAPAASLRGHEMKRSEIRHLMDWLRELPLRARTRIAGLSPDRADIIVAGAVIVERVMRHLDVNRLLVHDGGIRDGLLRSLLQVQAPSAGRTSPEPPEAMRSVRQFAASCGYEERHCLHVAQLAGRIFDQLSAAGSASAGSWGDTGNRLLLEAAALLKDVGYLINYSKHHLHTFHLIIHSDLAGFTPREVQLVANIARYHRKARPKKQHANFASLAKPDRELVRRLSAILRIADGLDRTRQQNVRDVEVHLEEDRAVFVLDAEENPHVEIWGAADKSGLFARVFGVEPHFEWKQAQLAK